MDQFNLRTEDDVRLFRDNNGAKRNRLKLIISEGQENINAQLIKDFIQTHGLDIHKDREEIIALCQEIGVEPQRVGIEIEEPTPEITRNNNEMSPNEVDGRD